MTTGNGIETYSIKDALYVPLEAVSSEGGVPLVYKRSGGSVVKQEVVTGAMNDDEVIIGQGLAEDDQVLLTPPQDKDQIKLNRLPGSTAGQPKAAGGDTALGPRRLPSPTPGRTPATPPKKS